jgi:hypothetical protein
MQALSQLSYGPEGRKSSAEFVIPGPVDQTPLVVASRAKPKLNGCPIDRHRRWEEIARVELGAVRGDDVDLALLVRASDEPIRAAPEADAIDERDLGSSNRPLALDAQEPGRQIKGQVVGCVMCKDRDTMTPSSTAALVIAASAIAPF